MLLYKGTFNLMIRELMYFMLCMLRTMEQFEAKNKIMRKKNLDTQMNRLFRVFLFLVPGELFCQQA